MTAQRTARHPVPEALAEQPMSRAFDVTVSAVRDLSPSFRRITLGGYALRDFGVHGPTLDLRVKLVLPSRAADGTVLPLPVFRVEEPGWYRQWLAMDPDVRGSMRTYTVRRARLDAVYPEIDVDIVLHGEGDGTASEGPGATWARQARPGDRVTLIGPNSRAAHCVLEDTYAGIEWRPGTARRILLAGDETAVPAICAILETLPPHLSGDAVLEVPDAGDIRNIRTEADVAVTWLARGSGGAGQGAHRGRPHGELLRAAVRDVVSRLDGTGPRARSQAPEAEAVTPDADPGLLWETPDGATASPFYAWIAGEAGTVRELRRYLVREAGIDRAQLAFMGYWRQGRAEL